MLRTILLLLISICTYGSVFSQHLSLKADFVDGIPEGLSDQFRNFELFDMPTLELKEELRRGINNNFDLNLNVDAEHNWELELQPNSMLDYHHSISVATPNGIEIQPYSENVHYVGQIKGVSDSRVYVTITENFLLAFIRQGKEQFVIEPLRTTIEDAPFGQHVLYDVKDIIPGKDNKCSYQSVKDKIEEGAHQHVEDEVVEGTDRMMMTCLETEIAIACDFSMNAKYGGVSGAASFASGIMGAVQGNYDSDFNNQILFEIVEIFVSDCSTCDPWTTSTNASTVLTSFRNWGNSVGFPTVGGNFDVGQFWTNRNLAGSTIGIAWLDAICTGNRYHVCQDFSSNANLLRVLTAHELGHNFGSGHDGSGSGFIMAPSVNNTSTWSAASRAAINGSIPSFACLGSCASEPTASFTSNVISGCAPLVVQFNDVSGGNPDTWAWSFPGGNPSFSNQKNPVVVYDSPGFYDVSLEVSNAAGSDFASINSYIEARTVPIADADFNISGRSAAFTNLSIDASNYLWEFGDGATSTAENPTHTYSSDGQYFVQLTAFNECGPSITVFGIFAIALPSPDFDSDIQEGCGEVVVNFTDESIGTVDAWKWLFPGGTPSSSDEQNPTVVYDQPGSYDVTLFASNLNGERFEIKSAFITVNEAPDANFSFTANGNVFQFIPQFKDGSSYFWSFGDGSTSDEKEPTHEYLNDDDVTVVLEVSNACGQVTESRLISLVPNITFTKSTAAAVEASVSGSNDCRGFVDVQVELTTSKQILSGDAIVTLSVDGDAEEGADYEILTNPIIFPANGGLTQEATIRIFDDQAFEGPESALFTLSVSGGSNAIAGDNDEFELMIEDNDGVLLVNEDFSGGSLPDKWLRIQAPGSSGWEFGRAVELASAGFDVPGNPTEMIAGVNATKCDCNNSRDQLVLSAFSLANLVNAKLIFDVYMPGTEGSTGQILVNTGLFGTYGLADIDATPGGWARDVTIDLDRFIGQNFMRLIFKHDDKGGLGDGLFLDNIRVIGQQGTSAVANVLGMNNEVYVGPNANVFFLDADTRQIIAQLENQTDFDYGCTTIEIDRAGTGATAFEENAPESYATDRTLLINPTNNDDNGQYRLTMYYRSREIFGYENASGNSRSNLRLISSPGAIKNVTPSDPQANGPNQYASSTSSAFFIGNNVKLRAEFTGPLGGYTAGASTVGTSPFDLSNTSLVNKAVLPQGQLGMTEASFEFFPNPAVNTLNVKMADVAEEMLTIRIYSAAGHLMSQERVAVDGHANVQLDMSTLAGGVYFVKVEGALGTNVNERIVKR